MGYTAKAVANHLLDFGLTRKNEIPPLKMQKLVYISHGWHLALSDGKPLVSDEYVEAWPYGPVFPSVYHEFKHYGASPHTRLRDRIRTHGKRLQAGNASRRDGRRECSRSPWKNMEGVRRFHRFATIRHDPRARHALGYRMEEEQRHEERAHSQQPDS